MGPLDELDGDVHRWGRPQKTKKLDMCSIRVNMAIMPGSARLDAPGVLHLIKIRG